MVLGTEELLKLVKGEKLIEDLDKRELKNPEGCGFDLRLEKLLKLKGKTFLGVTHREVVEMTEKRLIKNSWIIKPGEYYLSKTMEKVNIPENLVGIVKPRSTLYRSGILLRSGQVSPGYRGDLYFGIYNAGEVEFEIEKGARYAHIMFFEVKGSLVRGYEGQWQGGRATTEGKEKQI